MTEGIKTIIYPVKDLGEGQDSVRRVPGRGGVVDASPGAA